MSISAYVGLPGHGKSYGAVENVIIPALKAGRRVFTNIPCNEDLIIQDFQNAPIQFETSELQKNPDWFQTVFIAGSVLVFDECWRLWPSGLKANVVLEQHKSFLAEHRHMVGEDGHATEIYLVTQDLSQIANFARALVETTYRMVKRTNLGFDKLFRVDIYEGAVTGSKPPKEKLINSINSGKFSPKIYQYYKSHTQSKTGLAGNEKRTDQRANGLGRLSIKMGFIGLFIFGFVAWYGFSVVGDKFFSSPSVDESVSVSQPVPFSSSSPVQNTVRPPKKQPFLSDAKFIFISHRITIDTQTKIYIDVEFEKSNVVLDLQQLSAMGYTAKAVADCLFELSGHDYSGYVSCGKPSRKSEGMIKSLIAPESEKG